MGMPSKSEWIKEFYIRMKPYIGKLSNVTGLNEFIIVAIPILTGFIFIVWRHIKHKKYDFYFYFDITITVMIIFFIVFIPT
jgi:hypothetical protein